LTSFAGVLGFEVSRYFALNDRACLARLFFARTWIKPASCKAFSFRIRSQMGFIEIEKLSLEDRVDSVPLCEINEKT
jgi:phosphopantetheinyl transferase (holo-ACP synthase)